MEYYHDLVVQKSWQELKNLQPTVDFILIGGWAVYLYTKGLKSKDIDIVVDFDQLSSLSKNYSLFKNDRLKKYEAVREEVQIDIYLPHYSRLGLPVEDLMTAGVSLEGFRVLEPNFLAVLKIYTLAQRGRSPKGRKDFLDLLSLFLVHRLDLIKITGLIDKYSLRKELDEIKGFLAEQDRIKELNLNPYQYSKLKKELIATLFT